MEDDLVRDVRLIKSARELALYREAGEYVTRAHVAMMEALIAGESESEAASRPAHACSSAAATGIASPSRTVP